VGQLTRGESVRIGSVRDGWAPVLNTRGDTTSYVYAELLERSPLPPLEISDWNWRADRNFGTRGAVIYNVSVRNNTNEYVPRVRVEFTTYDANERMVTTTFTFVSAIPPGGVRERAVIRRLLWHRAHRADPDREPVISMRLRTGLR
jgi:hypothetical protein